MDSRAEAGDGHARVDVIAAFDHAAGHAPLQVLAHRRRSIRIDPSIGLDPRNSREAGLFA